MSKKKNIKEEQEEIKEEVVQENEKTTNQPQNTEETDEEEREDEPEKEEEEQEEKDPLEKLQEDLDEAKNKYMRLSAEFDNFRKRTQREKMDLIRYGSEDVLKSILPLVDDFERALKVTKDATDVESLKEGITLIYGKFADFLKSNNVEEIEAIGQELDTDLHEAITKIPVDDKKKKGIIVDVIEKGYKLNDKVIRYSKVVVGE
ncbi:MAG: nucleotide exchange factor GrpE [Bacteroidales bacterium]